MTIHYRIIVNISTDRIESGAVTTTHNGQVIDGVMIRSGSDGITILHDNVTVRNARIIYNIERGGGVGIRAVEVSGLRVEGCEIINGGAPARGSAATEAEECIALNGVSGAAIESVTARCGNAGIYALNSSDLTISRFEGHDMRGPEKDAPGTNHLRGQVFQFNKCSNVEITDFSYEGIPATSYEEDNINLYGTDGFDIQNGYFAFATDATHGVVLMAEASNDGPTHNGTIANISAKYLYNGFISLLGFASGIEVRDVRAAHILPWSVHGKPASDAGSGPALMNFNVGATCSVVSARYWQVDERNLAVGAGGLAAWDLAASDWEGVDTLGPIRNAFPWRSTGHVPTELLPPRIGGDISDRVGLGQTLVLLPGKYLHDPTSRTWQWYANGVEIPGATDMTLTLGEAEVGKAITVGETPANAAGAGTMSLSTPTSPVVFTTLPNMLPNSNNLQHPDWTGNLIRESGIVTPSGKTLNRLTSSSGPFQICRRTDWPTFTAGEIYSLTFATEAGTHTSLGVRCAGRVYGDRYVTFNLVTGTVNMNGVTGVTAGFYLDSGGHRRGYFTTRATTPTEPKIVDFAIVPPDGDHAAAVAAGLTLYLGEIKLARSAVLDDWVLHN